MTYVVLTEFSICPKCLNKHIGAAVSIGDDLFVCTDCYNKYMKELEPKMWKMFIDYFQPMNTEHPKDD